MDRIWGSQLRQCAMCSIMRPLLAMGIFEETLFPNVLVNISGVAAAATLLEIEEQAEAMR
eukprot:CAMPEP_0202910934 /NCGR_PEP_ID=MMETSP1392-20130828/53503_1 /ASSEMBLY_ACC=CAM_ASM_000868 /TAXON_ID=225041 /ORGANISM="Chlamydomonas chlamydogama, Strain SAG 11-48b" /LENGTH=59 /DNA_ID=CAMNT_0049601231 /DNA_START=528 /DNA_END=704 /DNA_ORIENTATION=-